MRFNLPHSKPKSKATETVTTAAVERPNGGKGTCQQKQGPDHTTRETVESPSMATLGRDSGASHLVIRKSSDATEALYPIGYNTRPC